MHMLFAIAAGGALGALARHGLAGFVGKYSWQTFPIGILSANILGCLLMGTLIELLALKLQMSPAMRAFLVVGFLGAMTTFSSFALEAVLLYEKGALWQGFTYVAVSVLGSLGALCLGLIITRCLIGLA